MNDYNMYKPISMKWQFAFGVMIYDIYFSDLVFIDG